MKKTKVLFVSVGKGCSALMAEAIMNHLYDGQFDTAALGATPELSPEVKAVLAEVGIEGKGACALIDQVFQNDATIDHLILLGREDFPDYASYMARFPNVNSLQHGIDEPSILPSAGGDGLLHYRRVRDEILIFLKGPVIATLLSNTSFQSDTKEKISFFEKYLTVWVLLCMVIGALIGYFRPDIVENGLKKAEIYRISIPISVLLWVMIFPMLLQIDFQAIWEVMRNPGPIFLTTFVNFGIQPFTMYLVAYLFFNYIYAGIIPHSLAQEYLAGCILLGGAPCTAMVFVWSVLVGGSPGYTLMQVAINDAIMLVLYLPTMLLLLNASSIPLPYETIAISVCFFIAIPLFLAALTRHWLLRHGGKSVLDGVINSLKPVCTVGLLATLVLIFIYQGRTMGEKPLHILLIIVPLSIQTFAIFGLTFWLGYMVCMEETILFPAALISTSNFFELAVAIAISIYGPESGASLATVVGVLVEVPTMLCLVWLCKRFKGTVQKRCSECDEKCPHLRALVSNCSSNNNNSKKGVEVSQHEEDPHQSNEVELVPSAIMGENNL
eukprot:gene31478-38046_t